MTSTKDITKAVENIWMTDALKKEAAPVQSADIIHFVPIRLNNNFVFYHKNMVKECGYTVQ